MSAIMHNSKRSSRGCGVKTRISSASGASSVERGRLSSPGTPCGASSDLFHCVTCKFPVLDNEEGGIACDECKQWCHGSQVCTGLPKDFVKEVLKHQGKGVKYVCTKCRLQTPAATKGGTMDQAELVSLRDCMNQMFNTIAGLSNMVRTIDMRLSDKSNDNFPSAGIVDESTVRALIREETRELQERDKRKNSIIIRGLLYGEDFQDRFNTIVSFLYPGSSAPITLKDVVPISPSLVRAKISSLGVKQDLLSRSSKLSKSPFSNVYISRDLTYLQREELRKRRAARQVAAASIHLPVSSTPLPPDTVSNENTAVIPRTGHQEKNDQ